MKKLFSVMAATLVTLLGGLSAFAGDVASEAPVPQGGASAGITLVLLLKGMLGIFVVMGLIYLSIVILNKLTDKNKEKDEDKNGGK